MRSWIHAVAVDLDGTTATDDAVAPEALAAINSLRQQHIRVILATGRTLTDLHAEFPGLVTKFDAVVAENGCLLQAGDLTRRLADPVPEALVTALTDRGIPFCRGDVLLATSADHDAVVLEQIGALGLDSVLLRNRGELMVLPAGVSKGSGLQSALDLLRISRHNTVAIGDAENDHAMFDLVELGVATANAVPAVKAHADLVLSRPNGAGVAELITQRVLPGGSGLSPGLREVTIGRHADGSATGMPSTAATVLVVGGSGRGKSYLAGTVAEQLIEHGYCLLVIDPEGEQRGLAELPDVRIILGTDPDPVDRVIADLSAGFSVVLDLTGVAAGLGPLIHRQLAAAVGELRAEGGMPHWIVVDEAQSSLGADGSLRSLFDPAAGGHLLVTYQPDQLCADILSSVDLVLSAGPPIDQVLGTRDTAASGLAKAVCGQALMLRTDVAGPAVPFVMASRATNHQRHQHKYAQSRLPAGRGFSFRSSHTHPLPEARTIDEFRRQLGRVSTETLSWHLGRADVSRWLGEVVQDRELAVEVAALEHNLALRQQSEVVESRTQLDSLIGARYSG